jgi:hypothetical protein
VKFELLEEIGFQFGVSGLRQSLKRSRKTLRSTHDWAALSRFWSRNLIRLTPKNSSHRHRLMGLRSAQFSLKP